MSPFGLSATFSRSVPGISWITETFDNFAEDASGHCFKVWSQEMEWMKGVIPIIGIMTVWWLRLFAWPRTKVEDADADADADTLVPKESSEG